MKKISFIKSGMRVLFLLFISFATNVANAQVEVHLIKFTADCHGDYSYVNWSSSVEIDAESFMLERSEDQINWTLVDNVLAENFYATQTNYQITDNTPSISGTNYYRLTAIGVNGDTLMVSDEGKCGINTNPEDPGIITSPNPTTGKVTVVTPITGTIEPFSITDRTGQVIKKGFKYSKEFVIDMEDLDRGLYFLFIGNNANPVKIWKQ